MENIRKDSELSELRIASDEAVKLAETADDKCKQIETYFSQELHNITSTYETKVLMSLLGHMLILDSVCGPQH